MQCLEQLHDGAAGASGAAYPAESVITPYGESSAILFFLIFSPVPFGERGRGEEGPVAANGRASRQRASQSPVGQEQEGLGLRWVGDRVTSESREGN